MKINIFFIFLPYILLTINYQHVSFAISETVYRSYECAREKCFRTKELLQKPPLIEDPLNNQMKHSTMASCRLSCDIYGSLWPVPTGQMNLSRKYVAVHPANFYFDLSSVPTEGRKFVDKTNRIFLNNLRKFLNPVNDGGDAEDLNSVNVNVFVNVNSSDLNLDWETDESYTLELNIDEAIAGNGTVEICATTVYGARHAMETLIQLTAPVIKSSGDNGIVILRSAFISDDPIYSHRGLLIDTARNFVPLNDILRTIDGLSSCKMNVLHWHATDTQSFPLLLKSVPAMASYGAYDQRKIYTTEDMALIVEYGRARGVRVIVELDAPAHSGSGWEWGEEAGLGSLAVCLDSQPWRHYCIQPPCGQLNPVNKNVYDILGKIYKDFMDVWGPAEVFHMGGDEVFLPCWNSTYEIIDVMSSRGMNRTKRDFIQLWSEFQETLLNIVDEERRALGVFKNVSSILWTSELTNPDNIEEYLDKNRYVIHTWVESKSWTPSRLLDLGYRIIISTKDTWYLDHGVWGNTRYHSWRDVYMNRIPNQSGVLGGEVAMWGEYVDGGSFDPRIWPRAAAAAERLWSDPPGIPAHRAENRLQGQRDRLMVRGIHPDAIFPEWCAQHDGQCQ